MPDFRPKVGVVRYPDRPYYMMRFVDPITGQHRARSTRTNVRREAERMAAKWEAELLNGQYRPPCNITWEDFRERYEAEKAPTLAANTVNATATAFNHLERIVNPKHLGAINSTVLSQFHSRLRKEGMKPTTLATHLRHLRAAFSWAVSMEMLPAVPNFHMPARPRGQSLMRGRPVTLVEFQKMLANVTGVRPRDADSWRFFLQGLWLSGLRIDEAVQLSWDDEEAFAIELAGRHPKFRIYAEAEKGRRDRLLPMTPDFAEFVLQVPPSERAGYVFRLSGRCTKRQMTSGRASRIVSAIGKSAGIVVNKADQKYASAHDLRRAFGTRWAARVKPATLQLLMRHKSIETTMKYYVHQDADDVADELWAEYGMGWHRDQVNRDIPFGCAIW
jgi:integrase